ncbi:hypothetical protein MHYP_G00231780 [Metynnis hypsauchen]
MPPQSPEGTFMIHDFFYDMFFLSEHQAMELPYSITVLRVTVIVVLCCTGWSFAENQLLCSSEAYRVWYDYEGPIYHMKASLSPCYLGMNEMNLNYSMITMFTIKRAGFYLSLKYQNKLWVEFSEPVGSCGDLKICHIIKGESFQESLFFHFGASGFEIKGEYLLLLRINIIDDFEREFTVNATINIHVNGR